MYKAHINEKTKKVQSVKEHCLATAQLASEYSVPLFKQIVYAIGLLHDIGKYQPSFQERIDGKNIMVEHSGCGAIAAKGKYRDPLLKLMQFCIAGHHSGIPDGGVPSDTPDMPTLYGRLSREYEDFSEYKNELSIPDIDEKEFARVLIDGCRSRADIASVAEKFAFITRYCFSCLTDADSNDTARFCNGSENRELTADFTKCLEAVNAKLNSFNCETELQKARALIQQQVYDKTDKDAEIYLMNMPTGSGKTLCSMKFALERAIRTEKRRIIYIIPYNSIIDQTARQFEELFGDFAEILRHQSTFSYDDTDKSEDYKKILSQAAENWNAQIIITTAVQFFESVYANKRGKLRKLHNMANSILVFDEAHLMPKEYLQPCLRAISYITRLLGSEAVFLTATMPDFQALIKEYALPDSRIANLVDDFSLFEKFKKCDFEPLGEIDIQSLLTKAKESPTSLIVVNKRKTAREIYSNCSGRKFHLSTYMTPFDRKNVIDEIKNQIQGLERDYPNLENVPYDRKITVVSTSLIEAGVDLDFYTVFRETTGLDSILQAGGRCNREGKRVGAKTFIFTLERCNKKASTELQANLTKSLISQYEDVSCPECIESYYKRLFTMLKDEIVKNSITAGSSGDFRSLPFKTYAERFELIDSKTISIVAQRDAASAALIDEIKLTGHGNQRKLQNYAFTVYNYEFEELLKQHAVEDYGSGIWCLKNKYYYDDNIGVLFEPQDYFI